jgi:hypothetical protein
MPTTFEKIQYILNFSSWVSSISSSPTPSILKVVDILATATNVSSTVVAAGSATISGTNITLPLIQSLTLNKTYRVHVNFNNGSPNTEVFEANFLIRCIS